MNKDRESLEALLKQNKEHYQDISRSIHWTAADSAKLDDLMNSTELKNDIRNRITKAAASREFTTLVPSFLIYKAWQRTKAVYSFNKELVADIALTTDTELRTALLEHLPFKDMLFFFSEGTLPKYKDEETTGIFIHIERHPEHLWIVLELYDRKCDNASEIYPGIFFSFPITNGMKVSQIFETPQYLNRLSANKRAIMINHHMSEQEADVRLLDEKKALNTAILLLYYLSSENADIKTIKHHKKPNKSPSNTKEDAIPAVELHEVGNKYAEIIYRQWKTKEVSEEDDDEKSNEEADDHTVKTSKKRRPHVRRAHFQHYWIGEGRTEQVVRWKTDLFVGVNRDDQAVVVYEMPRESLKGKKNPNSSKKKRGNKT